MSVWKTVLAGLGSAHLALAAAVSPIQVRNADFESPAQPTDGAINTGAVTAWTESGGTIGTFNPDTRWYTNTACIDTNGGVLGTMAGRSVLFFYQSAGQSALQTLTQPALPGVRYTLTASVGDRDVAPNVFGGYTLALQTGGTSLATRVSSTPPAAGTFADVTLPYTAQAGDPVGPLQVRMAQNAGAGGSFVDYDNIRLTAELLNPLRVAGYAYDGAGAGATPSTSPAWPDTGGAELTDGLLPTSPAFTNAAWVGFQDVAPDDGACQPQVTFDLGGTYALSVIQIVYLHSTTQAGGSITAPEDILVSFSTDGATFSAPVSYAAAGEHDAGNAIRTALLDVRGQTAAHVRLEFRNASQWTFLAECAFAADGSTTNLPPVVLDEDFAGTNLDSGVWIEHDSGARVNQSNQLTMATGTGTWTDCGLESVRTFYRDGDLRIVTEARVSTIGQHATPIGYGGWDPATAAYFVTFHSSGKFYTWKGFTGVNTGVACAAGRWYRFGMRLTPQGVSYQIYADANDDGDFDDAGEDADLLATAPGRYLADASVLAAKVRFNNHSAGLLTVRRVTVRESVTHAALQAALTTARSLYAGSVEGTADGQYPPAARAALQAAIAAAEAVDADTAAAREALAAAEQALTAAVATFRAAINGGLPVLHHILGTGQSLSVGWNGSPPLTTTQPYGNLMLSGQEQTGADLVPLVEGPNLHGALVETISSALANTLTARSPRTNYTSIVTRHGEGSVAYAGLKKGTSWYARGLEQIQKAQAAALARGGAYRVAAVTTVHGESDHLAGNGPVYERYLREWQADYQADARRLTGQTNAVPLFFCQMSSHTKYNAATSLIPGAQLSAAENSPVLFLVCPKYFLTYSDGVHLTAASYRHLGEYYGKVLKQVLVDKADWKPLLPTRITLSGSVITADFHVPVPPLCFDTNAVLAQVNRGFEYTDDAGGTPIAAVALADADTIRITLQAAPTGAHPRLRYAYTGVAGSWAGCDQAGAARGNVRDSDATPSLYGNPLPNWLVHFDHPLPYDPVRDDRDNDGVPDRWENIHFGDTNRSHGAATDQDADTASDYAEWLADTDPNDPAQAFRIRGRQAAGGGACAVEWPTLTQRVYTVLASTNLLHSNGWQVVCTLTGNNALAVCTNLWQDKSRSFFRVRLSEQEAQP